MRLSAEIVSTFLRKFLIHFTSWFYLRLPRYLTKENNISVCLKGYLNLVSL